MGLLILLCKVKNTVLKILKIVSKKENLGGKRKTKAGAKARLPQLTKFFNSIILYIFAMLSNFSMHLACIGSPYSLYQAWSHFDWITFFCGFRWSNHALCGLQKRALLYFCCCKINSLVLCCLATITNCYFSAIQSNLNLRRRILKRRYLRKIFKLNTV